MCAHHDAIHLALAQEMENLICGESRPNHDFARNSCFPHSSCQRLKMVSLGVGGGGIVVIADTRGLRCGYYHRVVGMEQNKIRTRLLGLRKRKTKCLFIGGDLGGKQNGGGFAPPWL